jgi:hypothetical protein
MGGEQLDHLMKLSPEAILLRFKQTCNLLYLWSDLSAYSYFILFELTKSRNAKMVVLFTIFLNWSYHKNFWWEKFVGF